MKRSLFHTPIFARIAASHGDMLPAHLILANASLMITISLFADNTAFERPAYALLAAIAPQWAWGLAFIAHFVAEYWRLLFPEKSSMKALTLNIYGSLLWFACTLAMTWSIGEFAPSLAMAWSICIASGWALFRTGGRT